MKSQQILELLATVPKGKVTTYGALARATRSSPRAIGQVMRHNDRPDFYPCYKVIASTGKIHGYSGELKGQKIDRKVQLLKKDGIAIENGKIDLKKYLHKF